MLICTGQVKRKWCGHSEIGVLWRSLHHVFTCTSDAAAARFSEGRSVRHLASVNTDRVLGFLGREASLWFSPNTGYGGRES